jgi:hypothetical protein
MSYLSQGKSQATANTFRLTSPPVPFPQGKENPTPSFLAREAGLGKLGLSYPNSIEANGLLVVDSNRRMVSLNRKFIDLWSLPKHVIVSRDDDQALEFVSSQFEEPKSFLKDVRELYLQPDLEIHDLIKFKDGRMLERYSQPQWLEGKCVGRVWICRDFSKSSLSIDLS